MSIQVLLDAPKTPARDACIQSIQLAMKGDGVAWLELFAEDALVQDPYGPSPMDPSGRGHQGKAAIKAFCADHIRPGAIGFQVRQSVACGNACALVGTITTKGPDGKVAWCEIINHYEVNDEGKIILLRSFWEFDARMQTEF
jgi:ketosteroid isomerase-like protein